MGQHSSHDVGNLQGLVSSQTSSETTLKQKLTLSNERQGDIVVLLLFLLESSANCLVSINAVALHCLGKTT